MPPLFCRNPAPDSMAGSSSTRSECRAGCVSARAASRASPAMASAGSWRAGRHRTPPVKEPSTPPRHRPAKRRYLRPPLGHFRSRTINSSTIPPTRTSGHVGSTILETSSTSVGHRRTRCGWMWPAAGANNGCRSVPIRGIRYRWRSSSAGTASCSDAGCRKIPSSAHNRSTLQKRPPSTDNVYMTCSRLSK